MTFNNRLILKLPELPDLEMPKYTSVYGQGLRKTIVEKQNDFFKLLKELSKEAEANFSLRYTYSPEETEVNKLGIYLIINSQNPQHLEKIKEIINSSFLSEFYNFKIFEPSENDIFFNDLSWVTTIAEGIKKEVKLSLSRNLEEAKIVNLKTPPFYYYINKFEPKDSNDMCFLMKAFNNFKKRTVLDITLKYTTMSNSIFILKEEYLIKLEEEENILRDFLNPLYSLLNPLTQDKIFESKSEMYETMKELGVKSFIIQKLENIIETSELTEKSSLEKIISKLNELSRIRNNKINKIDINDEPEDLKDLNVDAAKTKLGAIYTSYLEQDLLNYSIRVLSEDDFYVVPLLSNLFSAATTDGNFRPLVYKKEESDKFNQMLESYKNFEVNKNSFWEEFWNKLREDHYSLLSQINIGSKSRTEYLIDYFRTLERLFRLHKLCTVDEIKGFFRFIVPSSEPVRGIGLETDEKTIVNIDDSKNKLLYIGVEEERKAYTITVPLKELNKHMFICGVPGSGKTTAVINLMIQLWCDHKIPFIVIEPAKTEYRTMKFIDSKPNDLEEEFKELYKNANINFEASNFIEDVKKFIHKAFIPPLAKSVISNISVEKITDQHSLFIEIANSVNLYTKSLKDNLIILTLGKEEITPFRFNPFEIIEISGVRINLDEHLSNLEQAFKSCIDLGEGGPLPALLSEALEDIYYDLGWIGNEKGSRFPTMEDLYQKLSDTIQTKNYSNEIKGNLQTALEVRIGSLLRRNLGKMLNTQSMFPSVQDLLTKPVVIELDSLNEYQANLMTMFLLMFIKEYIKVTRNSGSPLSHLIVIEEAHNIIGSEARSNSSVDTKAEATKIIVRMLAEMRALGEGFIIADQLPTAISQSAIKNTNIKLAHRIVSKDDREILANTMLLDGKQVVNIARFRPGQALIYQEGFFKARTIIEPNTKMIYGISDSISDADLLNELHNMNDTFTKSLVENIKKSEKEISLNFKEKLSALINNEKEEFKKENNEFEKKDKKDHQMIITKYFSEKRMITLKSEVNKIKSSLKKNGVYHLVNDNEFKPLFEILENPIHAFLKMFSSEDNIKAELTKEQQEEINHDILDKFLKDLIVSLKEHDYLKTKIIYNSENNYKFEIFFQDELNLKKLAIKIFEDINFWKARLKESFQKIGNYFSHSYSSLSKLINEFKKIYDKNTGFEEYYSFLTKEDNKNLKEDNHYSILKKCYELTGYKNEEFLQLIEKLDKAIEKEVSGYNRVLNIIYDLISIKVSQIQKELESGNNVLNEEFNLFFQKLKIYKDKQMDFFNEVDDLYIIKKFFKNNDYYYFKHLKSEKLIKINDDLSKFILVLENIKEKSKRNNL